MGCSEDAWPSTKRYVPPVRASMSQEMTVMLMDLGVHHRMSSAGVVHAAKTMRAGALKVRVTNSSRSDLRPAVVGFFAAAGSLFAFASIGFLLLFQFLDNLVQRIEA